MATWASIAKASPSVGATDLGDAFVPGACNLVVVDANAIIGGVRLESLSGNIVTIAEVLEEIRDKKSRQFLSNLPFGIAVQEPSEESLKTVLRFARETGDIHTLSTTDLKLLALAHSLEAAAHGTQHLRQHPLQAVARQRSHANRAGMQGWDYVSNPEEWKELDKEADDAAGAKPANSRLIQRTNLFHTDPSATPPQANGGSTLPGPTPEAVMQPPAAGQGSGPAAAVSADAEPTSSTEATVDVSSRAAIHADQVASLMEEDAARRKLWEESQANGVSTAPEGTAADDEEQEGNEAWQTAASSQNAFRRRKRRAIRRAAKTQAAVSELVGPMGGMHLEQPQGGERAVERPRTPADKAVSQSHDSGSRGKEHTMQVDMDDDEEDTASSHPHLAIAPDSPGDEVQSVRRTVASPQPPQTMESPPRSLPQGLNLIGAITPLGQPADPLSTNTQKQSQLAPPLVKETEAGVITSKEMEGVSEAVPEKESDAATEAAGGVIDTEQAMKGDANEDLECSDGQEEDSSDNGEDDEGEGDGDDFETELVLLEGDTGGVDLGLNEGREDGGGVDEGESQEGLAGPEFESSVATITADFAMQNVLLQIGLRLLTVDGKRIKHLSRWVLRCSACFFVTKEVGRIFCPRCGNMTMERAEVHTGPDGSQLYGIRRRPIIRGTKYSLPKPKGGRKAANPILREDELMMKMRRRKKDKAVDSVALLEELGPDTWFRMNQGSAAAKGINLLIPSAKNNPNERKPMRTNRRK